MFDLQPPRHIPTLPIASVRPDFNDFRSSPIADIVKEDVANPPRINLREWRPLAAVVRGSASRWPWYLFLYGNCFADCSRFVQDKL